MKTVAKTRVLAVGITRYLSEDTHDLPAASADAESFYAAIKLALGDFFDPIHSVLAIDVSADVFLNFLRVVLDGADGSGSQVVIYFSGHAEVVHGELLLKFVDARRGRLGVVASSEIGLLVNRFGNPVTLLVLDSCYAGIAGALSSSFDPSLPSRITVLASSQPYQTSGYGDEHSRFTGALVTSIRQASARGEAIGVARLYHLLKNELSDEASQEPVLFLSDGSMDIDLVPEYATTEEHDTFVSTFLTIIRKAGERDREALWYSVSACPERVVLDAATRAFKNKLHEPSWLVRRAVGSALSGVRQLYSQKIDLALDLIAAPVWMDVCVGLIGARLDLADERVDHAVHDSLMTSEHTMDARWLALLYAAERHGADVLDFTGRGLAQFLATAWGTCEVWERCALDTALPPSERAKVANRICELIYQQQEQVQSLATHLALVDPESVVHLDEPFRGMIAHEVLANTRVVRYARVNRRGRLRGSGPLKWLNSRLFGVWRGAVLESASTLLSTMPSPDARDFLYLCGKLPSVGSRMGVFESLTFEPELSEQFALELTWGFSDAHPWVRRVALEWLGNVRPPALQEQREALIAAALAPSPLAEYPGNIDLLYVAAKSARFLGLDEPSLPGLFRRMLEAIAPGDKVTVRRALENELVTLPGA